MKILRCDICGTEKEVSTLRLPVYRLYDSCDSLTHYEHPDVYLRDLDICYNCLMKCTNIYDNTVMGFGSISIQQNPELNARNVG